MMKGITFTNLCIFQFDLIHSFVDLFIRFGTLLIDGEKIEEMNLNLGILTQIELLGFIIRLPISLTFQHLVSV